MIPIVSNYKENPRHGVKKLTKKKCKKKLPLKQKNASKKKGNVFKPTHTTQRKKKDYYKDIYAGGCHQGFGSIL